MSQDKALLKFGEKELELPVMEGSEKELGIDISKLRASTSLVTVDNGFVNTASCTSAITFLNGEKGILKYRGYSIEELAEKSNFIEVSYLLMFGNLPSKAELAGFEAKIKEHSETKSELVDMMKCFPKNAHPMGVMSSLLSGMSGFYPENLDQDLSAEKKIDIMAQLMAQVKNISAYFYRISKGEELIKPNSDLDYCSDWLAMMGFPTDDDLVKALNVLLILHADHEQNCSASSVRLVGSSKANLYATIASGVNALWGPLHGGANQAVIEMLEEIQKAGGDYKGALGKAKDKADPFQTNGFWSPCL